jgi:ATP-dependent phosphoenolpyruvate carboxykinase
MWMSNIYIMVNRHNYDKNDLGELCAAVTDTGATIVSVDEQSHLIEANTPIETVATIAAMEGVCYVRCIFSYLSDESSRQQQVA